MGTPQLRKMRIYIYDGEVYAHDWLFVFRSPDGDNYIEIANDNYKLKAFLNQDDILIGGFNNKHYDDWILLTILNGGDPERVKAHNDHIIGGGQGWEYPFIKGIKKPFRSFDLKDDLPIDLSLKAIEGNMCLPIVETSVDFNLARKLTRKEFREVLKYCKNDVDATVALFNARGDYLKSKRIVGEMYGVPVEQALGLTNAKLSARVLGAKRVDRSDERDYRIPPNLSTGLIPDIVLNFFLQIRDRSITDEKLFGAGKGAKGLTLDIWLETSGGRCPVTYAWGGVHGGKPAYHVRATGTRLLINFDVSSLYPNSMINFGYCSRSMEDPHAYEKLVDTRMTAKKAGDKDKANALKLVVNTVYGAMLNPYNDLADRWAGRSVCISNQLAMTQLITMLSQRCRSIDFVNINTDGIMFEIDADEEEVAVQIVAEWSAVTGFEMERDDFAEVWQKDVNNYIGILTSGKMKTKGGFVSLYNGGSFKSNSEVIIDKAVVDYLVKGIPVEQTIRSATNIFDFQRIEKTGGKYEGSYHYVNGERKPIQNVNRIYAVKEKALGQIVKGKWITEKRRKDKSTGKMIATPVDPPKWQESTISDCPPHAGVDNENKLTLQDLDLSYYIDRAKSRVDKYINLDRKVENKLKKIKEVVSIMATTKAAPAPEEQVINWRERCEGVAVHNVYEKLLEARRRFKDANVKKSGINRYAEFKYFTLDDIIPIKTKIFADLGLVDMVSFGERASLTLLNVDNPDDFTVFTSPVAEDQSLIKNPIQKLGAVETYVRRYLYMLELDIVEADAIDEISGKDEEKPAAAKAKSNRPATPEKREEVKKELIDEDGKATDVQIKSIKTGLKKLRAKNESYEPYIREVLKLIKAGMSKADAEAKLIEIGEKVAE